MIFDLIIKFVNTHSSNMHVCFYWLYGKVKETNNISYYRSISHEVKSYATGSQ